MSNYEASQDAIRQVWQLSDDEAIHRSITLGQDYEPLRAYYPFTRGYNTWPPEDDRAFNAEIRTASQELSIRIFQAAGEHDVADVNDTYHVGPYYIQTQKYVIRGIALWMPRL